MVNLEDQLKNPVWYSLKETHKKLAVVSDGGYNFITTRFARLGGLFSMKQKRPKLQVSM
ncbi:hypothetical protein JCM19274_5524 [Algibacter lectus]|uniref:Uncharacterized protein n=1 Tax=Algibacter lectus TaxID=221126 RepID=A0A090WLD0_9FLAO|nr:hypothetical protein [Algibacter lectus]GAL77811.1 hypothetical protein JCM19274_5524 [Algibacter lectus]